MLPNLSPLTNFIMYIVGASLVSGIAGAYIASLKKLGKSEYQQDKIDHTAKCPENREVLTLSEHERECRLKLQPIYARLERIESNTDNILKFFYKKWPEANRQTLE